MADIVVICPYVYYVLNKSVILTIFFDGRS